MKKTSKWIIRRVLPGTDGRTTGLRYSKEYLSIEHATKDLERICSEDLYGTYVLCEENVTTYTLAEALEASSV